MNIGDSVILKKEGEAGEMASGVGQVIDYLRNQAGEVILIDVKWPDEGERRHEPHELQLIGNDKGCSRE